MTLTSYHLPLLTRLANFQDGRAYMLFRQQDQPVTRAFVFFLTAPTEYRA